jgi:hypothetical protein
MKASSVRERDYPSGRAMYNALHGHCYACVQAKEPKITTTAGFAKFPNMVFCEHLAEKFKGILAKSGESKQDCEYWEFDEERFGDNKRTI